MTDVLKSCASKTVLVVGAARSGIAVSEFLLSRGARVVLTDTKSPEELASVVSHLRSLATHSGDLQLELGGHNMESFRICDLVIPSPGVPLTLPHFEATRRAGIPIVAEIELAYHHLRGMILGITGSNGKTTTTALVGELLRAAGLKGHVAGNIGIPLITFVSRSTPEDIYSTELSSFQLECIRDFRPRVASILNLSPDHLDRYPSFEGYVAAKRRIFMNQTDTDFAVLNADDPRAVSAAANIRSGAVFFSRSTEPSRGSFLHKERLIYRDHRGNHDLFPVDDIRMKGKHNLENVLAACTIALLAGAAPESTGEAVRGFTGVEHRLEWVAEINGVQYFNDSKATNVDAAIKSLEAFPKNIHLISGGRDKGGDFAAMRPLVEQRVKHLIVIGEAAGKIRDALSGAVEISEAKSLEEAVSISKRRTVPGDFVLLAPACASFDMFDNYEHRGCVFKETVRSLRKAED